MKQSKTEFDAGHILSVVVFTIIVMAGLVSMLSGAQAPNALDHIRDEQTLTNLRES